MSLKSSLFFILGIVLLLFAYWLEAGVNALYVLSDDFLKEETF